MKPYDAIKNDIVEKDCVLWENMFKTVGRV